MSSSTSATEIPWNNHPQTEYCKLCDLKFADWDALLLHKVESKVHTACIFCGIEFRTLEGQRRHQQQNHAAQQDLSCAGCGEKFVRAGSYINHIEQHLCPVINKQDLEQRREKKIQLHNIGKDGMPKLFNGSQATMSIAGDNGISKDGSTLFGESPMPVPWGTLEKEKPPNVKDELDFPLLDDKRRYLSGGSKYPDLLTGIPLGLDNTSDLLTGSPAKPEGNKWLDGKNLFPDAPPPITPTEEVLAALTLGKEEEELHPWDPSNPNFQAGKYYNSITEKYKCPWPFCKKTFSNTFGLCQHLRSPAHVNKKLRCPACLRLYSSATALVQHAESQAKKCSIRDTIQYRQAVDQVTGGFLDTRGRHEDQTVRYVAPALDGAEFKTKGGPVGTGGRSMTSKAHDDYWTQKENERQAQVKYLNENAEW